MSKNQDLTAGFSLIELLIAISIMSIVMIVSIQGVARAMQQMTLEEHRMFALYYAEELMDLISAIRELSWKDFVDKSSPSGALYCVNGLINPSLDDFNINQILSTTGECTQFTGITGETGSVPRIYKRELSLTSVSSGSSSTTGRVNAVVTVSWRDFNKLERVFINSSFTIHE